MMAAVIRRLMLGVVVLTIAGPALAEPYFAVREGFKCSACHVNMTGGGKRTDLVSTHARDILHYPSFFGAFSNPPDFFSGEINKYLGLGADVRASETAVFQNEGTNGRVNNDKVFRGRLETNSLSLTETALYAELRLIPDYLTVYVDERVQPSTDNREAFGLVHGFIPGNGYIKAGRMFLPYGLQLQDDTAFIRGGANGSANTGFSFNQQQAGFEIGFEPGPFTLVAAVTDGPPNDRDVQITTTASVLLTDLPVVHSILLGNSFSRVGPPGSETVLFGFFGGSNIERFTWLTEADFRSDKNQATNGKRQGTFIAYAEGDYLLFDWLNIKVTGDYADDDGDLSQRADDSENRVGIGIEPFLNRFLQPRLFYRVSNGVQAKPTHNQNVLLAEMHFFF